MLVPFEIAISTRVLKVFDSMPLGEVEVHPVVKDLEVQKLAWVQAAHVAHSSNDVVPDQLDFQLVLSWLRSSSMEVPPLSSARTTAMVMPQTPLTSRAPFAIRAPVATEVPRRGTRWPG